MSLVSSKTYRCIIGALHTGTETGFTGSGSPIRIQCGVAWAPHGMQTTRIAQLEWNSRTVTRAVTQHSTQLGSGSRPCGGKVVFESGSPICIGFGSKVPCGEPHCFCLDHCSLWMGLCFKKESWAVFVMCCCNFAYQNCSPLTKFNHYDHLCLSMLCWHVRI